MGNIPDEKLPSLVVEGRSAAVPRSTIIVQSPDGCWLWCTKAKGDCNFVASLRSHRSCVCRKQRHDPPLLVALRLCGEKKRACLELDLEAQLRRLTIIVVRVGVPCGCATIRAAQEWIDECGVSVPHTHTHTHTHTHHSYQLHSITRPHIIPGAKSATCRECNNSYNLPSLYAHELRDRELLPRLSSGGRTTTRGVIVAVGGCPREVLRVRERLGAESEQNLSPDSSTQPLEGP